MFLGEVAPRHHGVEQDLDIDLVVGAVHPAGVVDEVGVGAPARQAVLHPPQLGHAQVAALADDAAAQLGGIHPQAVVRLVADVGVALAPGLDIGADAAVPQQVDRRPQQVRDQFQRRQVIGLDVEAGLHFGRNRDRLGGAGEHPAAGGHQLQVVVAPARARQLEQALALGEAGGGVGLGVDEDVLVVEGRHQPDMLRQQHAVAEHVAGHVADAHHGEVGALHVDADLAEMALHRHPGAAGGNAHLLVVVTGAAAGGEGVAQPEVVLGGDGVGDIGKTRRALVRRHHQVGVLVVLDHHLRRPDHAVGAAVVGDVQQRADIQLVAGDALLLDLVAAHLGAQLARHEAALGAHRHDHRVFHLLRLDQAQHLGAKILEPVRPAQAAAGDLAAAQVHTLHPGRVHVDFIQRHRLGYAGDIGRPELEREVALQGAVGLGLEEVGAQGGLDHQHELANDAVLAQVLDMFQRVEDALLHRLLALGPPVGVALEHRREAGEEQLDDTAGDLQVVAQGLADILHAEGKVHLPQVAGVGPQHGEFAPVQAGADQQAVEAVVLRAAEPDAREGLLELLLDLLQHDVVRQRVDQGELLYPVDLAIVGAHAVGALGHHPQAEVLEDGQHVGQGQARAAVVQAQAQHLAALLHQPVQGHAQCLALLQAQDLFYVQHRHPGVEVVAIARRETGGQLAHEHLAALLAELLDQADAQAVFPGQGGLHDLVLDLAGVVLQRHLRVDPQHEMAAHQDGLGKVGGELRLLGVEGSAQDALDFLALLGGVAVARDVHHAVDELAVDVAPHEQAGLAPLLDAVDRGHGVVQVLHAGLEQLVAREQLQHPHQLAALVVGGVEVRLLQHLLHLAPQNGNQLGAHGVHRRGVQADQAVLADDGAGVVEDLDLDVVGIGEPVHPRALARLGKAQLAAPQVVGRHVFQVGRQVLDPAGGAVPQQAQAGLGHHVNLLARLAGVRHFEVLVTEQGHVALLHPGQEGRRLLAQLQLDTLAGANLLLHRLQALAHGGEIVHHQRDLLQDIAQGEAQLVQLRRVGVAADLKVQHRLLGQAAGLPLLVRQHRLQFTRGVAAHRQVGAGDAVDGQVAPVQFAAHGGGAKGDAAADDGHHRVLALPAVALDLGVEDVDPGRGLGPGAQEAQQAVQAAVEVLHRALAHVLRREAAVKGGGQVVQGLPVGRVRAAVDALAQFRQQASFHCVPDHVSCHRSVAGAGGPAVIVALV